ncbi:hypothetical protein JCM11251_003078 [Rhodosporidiobolus azoricus]
MHSRPPTRSAPSRPATSHTAAASTTAADQGDWLISLLPSRGTARDVGVVALDKEFGHVVVTQYTDSSTFVKTVHLCKTKPPSIILLPQTALDSVRGKRRSMAAIDEEADEGGETAASGVNSETALLVKSLEEVFPSVPLVGVVRKYWNEQAGFEFLTQLIAHDAERVAVLTACKSKYYALSAAAALFKYLESAHGMVYPPRSVKIRYASLEGTCLIDHESAKNLELVANLLNKNSKQHLLGLLNRCFTPMGTRLLRSSILSPLTDPNIIDTRLDTVEELVNHEERFRSIRKALEPLKNLDLDKITSRLLTSTSATRGFTTTKSISRSSLFPSTSSSNDPSIRISQKLAHLLSLRLFLQTLPSLRSSVENSDSTLLRQIERILADEKLEEIAAVVRDGVNQDVWGGAGVGGGEDGERGKKAGGGGRRGLVGKHARLFAIKAERKKLLDVARETYRENQTDAYDLLTSYQSTYSLTSLQLVSVGGGGGGGFGSGGGAGSAGFVLTCEKGEWEEKGWGTAGNGRGEGKVFINITKKGKTYQMSTLDLKKRNARIMESEQEILLMSDEILDEMIDDIKGHIACLYRCAEGLAMLDILAGFADVSKKFEYVRPEWTSTLALKSARHPLHEVFRTGLDGSFVPNDTYASDAASFQLIFGPNMSGKSTLLRQTALLHVMAQIGCFVPAAYASFRPISYLLTRLSNDDNLEASLSTFASEMSTMATILSTLSLHAAGGEGEDEEGGNGRERMEGKGSLVIVDELGRGTSPEEGIGVAHAVAEEIIKSKAFCFFATHFKELSKTLSRYPNVVSLHLETEVDTSQPDYSLTFHHRVVDGPNQLTHYGLELAKLAKLPQPVLDKARLVSITLDSLQSDRAERAKKGKSGEAARLGRRRRGLLQLKTSLEDLASSRINDPALLRAMVKELQEESVKMLAETMPLERNRAVEANTETEEAGEGMVAGTTDVTEGFSTDELEDGTKGMQEGQSEVVSEDEQEGPLVAFQEEEMMLDFD